MGKSFKGFSRTLSVILTIAMMVTMMPAPVYGAELLADDSVDILTNSDTLVEDNDALVSDSVESLLADDSSDSIDTGLVAAPEADILDQNTSGEEGFGNDTAAGDVSISASGSTTVSGASIYVGKKIPNLTLTASVEENENASVAWKVYTKYTDASSTDNEEYTEGGIAGINFTASGKTMTISGTPTERLFNEKFTFVATSGSKSASQVVTITVTGIVVAAASGNPSGTFSSAKAGYVVGTGEGKVAPRKFEFENKNDYLDVDDLSITLKKGADSDFQFVGSLPVSIGSSDKAGFEVAPKEGLLPVNGKPYKDTIVIDAPSMDSAKEINVSFEVTDDITVTSNDKDTLVSDNIITLGNFKAGDTFDSITFTAASSGGDARFTTVSHNLLQGMIVSTGNKSTQTISGKVPLNAFTTADDPDAYPAVDYVVSGSSETTIYTYTDLIKVTDAKGNTKDYDLVFGVEPVNFDVLADGAEVGSVYEWASLSDNIAEKTVTFTVANTSGSDIEITASSEGADFPIAPTAPQTIKSGETKDFVVTPDVSLSANNAAYETTIHFTPSVGGVAEDIGLKFLVSDAGNITITSPQGLSTSSSTYTTLESAKVGEAKSYTFEATTADSLTAKTWSIDDVGKAKLEAYGFSFNKKTGVLSGTPLSENSLGIDFAVTVAQGESKSDTRYAKLVIDEADKAFSLYNNGVKIDSDESPVIFGVAGTSSADTEEETITVKNETSVPFTGLTATITDESYRASSTATWAPFGSDHFPLSVNEITGDNTKIAANGTQTFTITRNKIKGTSIVAGEYKATVKVTSTDNGDYFFTIFVTVAETPKFDMTGWTKDADDVYSSSEAMPTGKAVSIQLKAKVGSEDLTDGVYAVLEGTLPSGISLSDNGLIYGTPDKACEKTVTFIVIDPDADWISDTVDVKFTITGSQTVGLVNANNTSQDLTGFNAQDDAFLFGGGIKDAAVEADNKLEVRVTNPGTSDIEGLNIELEGITKNNAKAHFELSKTEIAKIEKKGYTTFTISPVNTNLVDTYVAKVIISGDTVSPSSFYVSFTVNEQLEIETLADTVTTGVVGTSYDGYDPKPTTVNGVSTTWSISVDDDDNEDTKLKELGKKFEAAGLLANDFDGVIDDHKATFTGFSAVTPKAEVDAAFNLNAKVAATGGAKVTSKYVKPEQTASIPVEMKISKSGDAVVVKGSESHSTAAVEEVTLSDKTKVANVVKGITFKSQIAGYSGISDTVTFTNKTGAEVSATVAMEKDDSPFTVTGSISGLADDGTAILTIAFADGKTQATEYTDNLVITSDSFETITIPVSASIEAKNYAVTVSDNKMAGTSFDLTAQMKNDTGANLKDNTFTIINTGNIAVPLVSVEEVKDAEGTEYGTGEDGQVFGITGTTTGDIPRDGSVNFKVKLKAAACEKEGDYTKYVAVTYKNGDGDRDIADPIILTLNYTIADSLKTEEAEKDIYYTPEVTDHAKTITLDNATEYSEEAPKTTISVKNGKVISATNTDSIFGLTATLTASNAENLNAFVLSAENGLAYEDAAGTDLAEEDDKVLCYKLDPLAKGSEAAFDVSLAKKLPMGNYTATLTIKGTNINTVTYTVKATVTGAEEISVEATTDGDVIDDDTQASRIFNTLEFMWLDDNPMITKRTTSDYKLNLNKGSENTVKDDIEIVKEAGTTKVVKLADCNVTDSDFTLSYTAGQAGGSYKTINIAVMNTVIFDKGTSVEIYDAETDAWSSFAADVKLDIPNGTSLAANDKAIPTIRKAGNFLKGWKDENAATETYLNKNDILTKDVKFESVWFAYEYQTTTLNTFEGGLSAAEDGEPVPGISWVWSEDMKDATLTLTNIKANAPEGANEASVQTFSTADTSSPKVVITSVDPTNVDPGCETFGKKTYTATVTLSSGNIPASKTYTDKKVVSEDAIGHDYEYDWATLTWAEDNSKATASRKCKNTTAQHGAAPEWETFESEAATSEITTQPTCAATGVEKFTAVFLNDKGEEIKKVEKEVEIPAKGHKTDNDHVIWYKNGSLTEQAVVGLICTECGEEFWMGKVTLAKNGNKLEGKASTPYGEFTVSRLDHEEHTWTFTNWSWDTTNYQTASAIFTCSAGGETTTVEATITSRTNGKTGSELVTEYTAKIEKDPSGKTFKKQDVKYVKADGTEGSQSDFNKTIEQNFEDDAETDGTFEAKFVDNNTEYSYTGDKIKPEVIVTNGQKTLVYDVDYTVDYQNNTNVINKNATVAKVKGKGAYDKSFDLPFTITAVDLNEVTVGSTVFKSNTKDKEVKPVISYLGRELKKDKDYVISPVSDSESTDENGNVVSKDFTLTPGNGGNFNGEKRFTVTYVQSPAKIKGKIDPPKYVYDGKPIDLLEDKAITIEGIKANELADKVSVTYSDPINAGKCKVVVTAEGFSGKLTKDVTIAANKDVQFTVDNAEALKEGFAFKASGVKPYVALRVSNDEKGNLSGEPLVLGKDYKLTWSNNKKVSKYNMDKAPTAKITFINNYKGSKQLQTVPFTINAADLTQAQIYMPETMTFNPGNNKNKAKDYLLKKGNNLIVTLNGEVVPKNDYNADFTLNDELITKDGGKMINGNTTVKVGDTLGVIIKAKKTDLYGTEELTANSTYTIVEAKDTALKTSLEKGYNVKILDSNDKNAKIGYTGKAIEFATTKKDLTDNPDEYQAYLLVENKATKAALDLSDCEITYVNNKEMGTATVIISAKDNNETATGSIYKTFKIEKHTFTQKDIPSNVQ